MPQQPNDHGHTGDPQLDKLQTNCVIVCKTSCRKQIVLPQAPMAATARKAAVAHKAAKATVVMAKVAVAIAKVAMAVAEAKAKAKVPL